MAIRIEQADDRGFLQTLYRAKAQQAGLFNPLNPLSGSVSVTHSAVRHNDLNH